MDTLINLAESWLPLYAVHMVEISLFILLVWAVDRWVKLDTRLKYSLWLLALVKVFVPPFFALPLPEFLTVSPAPVAPVALTAPIFSVTEFEPALMASVEIETPIPMSFYLFCLWALSAVSLGGVTLWKNAKFQRTLDVAVPVDLQGKLDAVNGTEKLAIYAKANLDSPLLVGIRKPRLYLPSQWSSWSPEQLRGVVAHELAHHANRDIWALIFQAVAMALFGLNPMIWLLNRRLSYLRELRCDEAVLRHTDLTPAEYGRLLFGFVDKTGRPALNALYFTERGTSLKERFEHVLNFKGGEMKRSKWQFAIPILMALAIIPFSIREAYTQAPGTVGNSNVESISLPNYAFSSEQTQGQIILMTQLHLSTLPEFSEEVKHYSEDIINIVQGAITRLASSQSLNSVPRQTLFDDTQDKVNVWLEHNIGKRPIENITFVIQQRSLSQFLPLSKQKFMRFNMRVPFGTWEEVEKKFSIRKQPPPANTLSNKPLRRSITVPEQLFEKEGIPSAWNVDKGPRALNRPVNVHYPQEAINQGIEDIVFVKFRVGVDGIPHQFKVMKGNDLLHQAAIDALSQLRFEPAEHKGQQIEVGNMHHVRFEMSNPPRASVPGLGEEPKKVDQAASSKKKEAQLWLNVNNQVLIDKKRTVVLSDLAAELQRMKSAQSLETVILNVEADVPEAVWQQAIQIGKQAGLRVGLVNTYAYPDPSHSPAWTEGDIFEFYEVDQKPKLIKSASPIYPDMARKAGLTGKVFLKFLVRKDGSISNVTVLKGPQVFHQAAIDAIEKFRFEPAQHKGQIVPVWFTQPVSFRLNSGMQASPPPPVTTAADLNDGEVEFYKVEQKPLVLRAVTPKYPESMRKEGFDAKIFLKYKVNTNGTVSNISVLKTTVEKPGITEAPFKVDVLPVREAFNQAAIEALGQFRFEPGKQSGKPVAVWMTLPIRFSLDTGSTKYVKDAANYGFDLGRFAINPPQNENGTTLAVDLTLLARDLQLEQVLESQRSQMNDAALALMSRIPLEKWQSEEGRLGISLAIATEINKVINKDLVLAVALGRLVMSDGASGEELPVDGAEPAVTDFKLYSNFPNPFNPETSIKYDLAEATFVILDIHTVTGQVIRTLVSKNQNVGRYQVQWDGKDSKGRPVASGTYYYRIKTDQFTDVQKMQLLK